MKEKEMTKLFKKNDPKKVTKKTEKNSSSKSGDSLQPDYKELAARLRK